MGDFPVFEQLTVDNLISLGTGTTLSKTDWLVSPWQDSGTMLSLDLRKMGFSQPMLEAQWLLLMTKITLSILSPVALSLAIKQVVD